MIVVDDNNDDDDLKRVHIEHKDAQQYHNIYYSFTFESNEKEITLIQCLHIATAHTKYMAVIWRAAVFFCSSSLFFLLK